MRTTLILAAISSCLISSAALAQDTSNPTTFRGIRIEANAGGDRFRSQGEQNDRFGYGGTIGFDGTIGNKVLIGAEGSYWRANNWSENCSTTPDGASVCHKSFEEWGAAVRAGYLVTPQLLVFGKGGYVSNEQRKRLDSSVPGASYYDHFNTTGYQLGGGVEYALSGPDARLPLHVNAQYVYSQYNDHTSRQRVMLGVGLHFK